jgi:hypothetical protein
MLLAHSVSWPLTRSPPATSSAAAVWRSCAIPENRAASCDAVSRGALITSPPVAVRRTFRPVTRRSISAAEAIGSRTAASLDSSPAANYKDEYREGLQRIIDAKIAGEEIVAPAVETPPRVVNLMEALKKSIDAVSTMKKKPAKAAVAQPAAKRKRA